MHLRTRFTKRIPKLPPKHICWSPSDAFKTGVLVCRCFRAVVLLVLLKKTSPWLVQTAQDVNIFSGETSIGEGAPNSYVRFVQSR